MLVPWSLVWRRTGQLHPIPDESYSSMAEPVTVVWFRSDLRLADQVALSAAVRRGGGIVAVFVLDETAAGRWAPGGASRWWLHHSLTALAADIAKRGGRLILRRGSAADELSEIARVVGADMVVCSRRYEPWAIRQEEAVRSRLAEASVTLKRYPGWLLMEPEAIRTKTGEPYKVYTPFWRALSSTLACERPLPPPATLPAPSHAPRSDTLADWSLLPTSPNWATGFDGRWCPGEAGAIARLDDFLADHAGRYAEARNSPGIEATSRLSPHLAHGEISPRLIWWRVASERAQDDGAGREKGLETFLKELVWREFASHLLFHFPSLPEAPFRPEFAHFPWRDDGEHLRAWQRGRTGFPIVDAGMRELWATGWMHNRVRMVVASFLIKDLLIPWQLGEAWFWDTLVDADLANNAASWQWVAGSGADAAPYFRVFNPTSQGEKFDADGDYVRRWVGEIAPLPDALLHRPAEADTFTLRAAGLAIPGSYPAPIVDHARARECALQAFKSLKSGDSSK